ncbi:general odorant-binding protein 56h-like [Onthophagus taurus]|uniref:general odorant-binding protein 56h-like n=1 Tax=Onthophagus taurus TaxID=166361 RepID=UPI000C206040|nr:uncharacterized protein LOC111419176 [Onthophagus taurus]
MAKMVLLLLLGFLFRGYSQDMQSNFLLANVIRHAQRCASQFNVNNAILNDFSNNQSLIGLLTAQKAIDRNVKCMIKCMMEQENYFVDRKINIQSSVVNTPQGGTLDIRKCTTVDDNDDCELVFKAVKCIVEEATRINN